MFGIQPLDQRRQQGRNGNEQALDQKLRDGVPRHAALQVAARRGQVYASDLQQVVATVVIEHFGAESVIALVTMLCGAVVTFFQVIGAAGIGVGDDLTVRIEPCILAGCPAGGTVLDPFFGAGTTGLVADRLGRNCIGIELNPEYAALAERRIAGDAGLFAQVQAA